MQVRAVARYIRMSPRKARLVAEMVRGRGVDEALSVLRFATQRAAEPIGKAIRSAAANAEENYGLNRQDLVVEQVVADQGPVRKGGRAGARGRYKPIRKPSTHITVVLSDREVS